MTVCGDIYRMSGQNLMARSKVYSRRRCGMVRLVDNDGLQLFGSELLQATRL